MGAGVEGESRKPIKLTRKDFQSDQDVRWCPGCGDYSILAQVQKVLADLGANSDNSVFVSGIGCSSRFPYYMNTYGLHSIHGRAPAIATGLKVARPELDVWVVTGDGDALSIGGNHFIHVLRRNVDLNILLFNNRIYGLTKGQYSPTSELGKRSPSTPLGSPDNPFNPLSVALGAGATFVARAIDTDTKSLQQILKAAADHKGTSFIEIYQNCNVFNDRAFAHITSRDVAKDQQLRLHSGKPLLFGKDMNKGIKVLPNGMPHVVEVGDGPGQTPADQLPIHDETIDHPSYAFMLSQLDYPDFPVPVGVLRAVEHGLYDQMVRAQEGEAQRRNPEYGSLESLWNMGDCWDANGATE